MGSIGEELKDENKLIEVLMNKKNSQNDKFKKFLNDKISTWMHQIDKSKEFEEDDEYLIDSIIKLIEKKNKEIEQLKSYSIFDINKYNSFVSV